MKRSEVALLEFVMKQCKRENTAIMARRRGGNFGSPSAGDDPFKKAAEFLNSRRALHPCGAIQKPPCYWGWFVHTVRLLFLPPDLSRRPAASHSMRHHHGGVIAFFHAPHSLLVPRRRNARPKDWDDKDQGTISGARRRQAVWEQNDALAASIAKAWLALPGDLRARTWPEWADNSAQSARVVTRIDDGK